MTSRSGSRSARSQSAAILLRPIAGRAGDRFGRRVLMIGGALIVGTTALCAGLVEALGWIIATRVLMGLGEACFFVGATTMATDLAPEERRGEAVSYWSVALWGGLAFGPVLGELLLNGSNYDLVWYVAGGLGLTAAAVALFTAGDARRWPRGTGEADRARGDQARHPPGRNAHRHHRVQHLPAAVRT